MVVYGSEQFKQRNLYVQHLDDGWGKGKLILREIFLSCVDACAIRIHTNTKFCPPRLSCKEEKDNTYKEKEVRNFELHNQRQLSAMFWANTVLYKKKIQNINIISSIIEYMYNFEWNHVRKIIGSTRSRRSKVIRTF